MQALLDFDRAPPFSAPLKFFLAAPVFLALAGSLVLVQGAEVFASRWMPGALAATHLVTIGFMLTAMLGALIQILPVVTGAALRHPKAVSWGVLAGLSLGVLALSGAFFHPSPALFVVAAVLLGGGALAFVAAAGVALWPVVTTSPTIGGLKLSLFGLTAVVVIGIWLALGLAYGWGLPLVQMVNLHAAWGFGAWTGVLLAAVCYVVVPMFHLTPPYRARPSWLLPPLLIAFAILWSAAVAFQQAWLERVAEASLASLGIAFALYTLYLQGKRRRARVDVPTRYWQCGLLSASLAGAMSVFAALHPALTESPWWAPLFGVLLAVGGIVSLIMGMLYRIVPFLIWLHLHQAGPAPSVAKALPEAWMYPQMFAHFLGVALLVAATTVPEAFARPAGAALLVDALWFLLNLLRAVRVYRSFLKEGAA